MFLSGLPLSLIKSDTLHALSSPNVFHEALARCGYKTRPLWRIDKLKDHLYMLILSDDELNLTPFCKKFAITEDTWKTKNYDSLLKKIEKNSSWHFRLTANPIKTIKGKRQALSTFEGQRNWIQDKADKYGFSVFDFHIENRGWKYFTKKDGNKISIYSATYEGFLNVTDTDLFCKALTEGIGHGKAYGMGLLTVVKEM